MKEEVKKLQDEFEKLKNKEANNVGEALETILKANDDLEKLVKSMTILIQDGDKKIGLLVEENLVIANLLIQTHIILSGNENAFLQDDSIHRDMLKLTAMYREVFSHEKLKKQFDEFKPGSVGGFGEIESATT